MNNEQRFNELCEKIASGQATSEQIQEAFTAFNEDISQFEARIKSQKLKMSV